MNSKLKYQIVPPVPFIIQDNEYQIIVLDERDGQYYRVCKTDTFYTMEDAERKARIITQGTLRGLK